MSADSKTIFLSTNKTIQRATFDITSSTSVVSAVAGKKTYVVAILMHNNDATATNDTPVRLQDGSGGTDLYGGSTGHIYLVGRGGFFGVPVSVEVPYFVTSTNTALYINPTSSKRVSGIVIYYQE